MARHCAYVCTLCHHLATQHRLTPGATDIVTGPYVCECGCKISQTTPLSGIDRPTLGRLFPQAGNDG